MVVKGVQVNQQFSDHLPQVEVVEDQIKQVILNLGLTQITLFRCYYGEYEEEPTK